MNGFLEQIEEGCYGRTLIVLGSTTHNLTLSTVYVMMLWGVAAKLWGIQREKGEGGVCLWKYEVINERPVRAGALPVGGGGA